MADADYEWQRLEDLGLVLAAVKQRNQSDRKMRLAAVAWCRESRQARADCPLAVIDLAERLADNLATDEDRAAAFQRAHRRTGRLARCLLNWSGLQAAFQTMQHLHVTYTHAEHRVDHAQERLWCAMTRDIFGNPFHGVAFAAEWRTTNVVELARTVYDERAFDRLAILADALLDAGCNDDDILDHCRGADSHVRGCWLIDLILQKH